MKTTFRPYSLNLKEPAVQEVFSAYDAVRLIEKKLTSETTSVNQAEKIFFVHDTISTEEKIDEIKNQIFNAKQVIEQIHLAQKQKFLNEKRIRAVLIEQSLKPTDCATACSPIVRPLP